MEREREPGEEREREVVAHQLQGGTPQVSVRAKFPILRSDDAGNLSAQMLCDRCFMRSHLSLRRVA